MPLDAGGAFLTKHCAIVPWFPRELTDAVTCCTQPSCMMEPGNKITVHSGTTRTTSQLNRVCGQKQMLHLRKCWTGKSVAGIINLFLDDLFGTGGSEMEQYV